MPQGWVGGLMLILLQFYLVLIRLLFVLHSYLNMNRYLNLGIDGGFFMPHLSYVLT